jgi:hypothetical protein
MNTGRDEILLVRGRHGQFGRASEATDERELIPTVTA